MEPFESKQQDRLNLYTDRLGDICDRIRSDLERSRTRRNQWFEQNLAWKKKWLNDSSAQNRITP